MGRKWACLTCGHLLYSLENIVFIKTKKESHFFLLVKTYFVSHLQTYHQSKFMNGFINWTPSLTPLPIYIQY